MSENARTKVFHFVPAWSLKPILFRLLLAATILLSLGVYAGSTFVEMCLPAYRFVFNQVADEFNIQSMALDRERADSVVRVRVTMRPILVIGGTVNYPDPRGRANASTLVAHVMQGPVLAMLIAIAWPIKRERETALRMLLLAPLLALLVLFDAPCVLAGELWEIILDHLAPDTVSPLIVWKDFLQGGGRYALGVVAGLISIALAAQPFIPPRPPPHVSSPAKPR